MCLTERTNGWDHTRTQTHICGMQIGEMNLLLGLEKHVFHFTTTIVFHLCAFSSAAIL